MTIQEAIDKARRLRDTELSDDELVEWMSAHDTQLWQDHMARYGYEMPEELPYTQYKAHEEDGQTVPAAYGAHYAMLPDEVGVNLYPHYLVMRIDLQHGDYERYNNDAMLYAADLQGFLNRISRGNRYQAEPPKREPWQKINLRF